VKGFFEVSKFKGGFGKIGRINLIHKGNRYIKTPDLIIPVNSHLIKDIEFIDALKHHSLIKFLNFDEFGKKLAKSPFNDKQAWENLFTYYGIVYINSGSFEAFEHELENFVLKENFKNIFPIIPYNVPTTALNRDFATKETQNYLGKCEILLESHKDIDFGLSVKIFDNFSLLEYYIEFIKKHENVRAIHFSDLFDNLKNFRNILNTIIKFRQSVDNNLLYIASGKITPVMYSMLVYLGFDLIDATYMFTLARDGLYNIDEKAIPLRKLQFIPCSCKVCQSTSIESIHNKSMRQLEFLYLHNILSALSYMNKLKQFIATEDFRGFVEKSSLSDSYLTSMLRILDRDHIEIVKQYTPVLQKVKKVSCISEISNDRPDFREFRRRVVNNFDPEAYTKLIVLIPCSAKKPYSSSKSHKKLLRVLRDTAKSKFPYIQEFVITSPLGVVPRQLEDVYPANSYDISVTGVWSEEEIKISSNMLVELLSNYPKAIPIIAHIEENYKPIIEKAKIKLDLNVFYTDTSLGITEKESLISLENATRQFVEKFEGPELTSTTNTETRKVLALIDYYLGKGHSKKIIKENINLITHKNKDIQFIRDRNSNELIGKFRRSTGQLLLTTSVIEALLPLNDIENFVVFNGDRINGNTIFRQGLVEYGRDLQPNDLVIVLNATKEKIVGMGTMLVGTEFIKNSKTGKIVDVYESRK